MRNGLTIVIMDSIVKDNEEKTYIMNYLKDLRKVLGQEMLMTVGCGCLLENENRVIHYPNGDIVYFL